MNEDRRLLLNAGAVGAAALLATAAAANAATPSPTPAPAPQGTGRAGEFDFLNGNWRIANRRLKAPGEWDEFPGESTCFSILGGIASIEELRIPTRNFSGMGLRLLDVPNRVWYDYWVNSRSGVLGSAGTPGAFVDGVGIFGGDDMDGTTPIKVRGVWDRITPMSCRWRQGTSRDGGATWEDNWLMDWTRV
jgi:opacity protein-like surface antigen